MARQARKVLAGVPMYVMVRGDVIGHDVFEHEDAKRIYLAWLRTAAKQYQLWVHAYCLLPNEFHLLATPSTEIALSRTMQSLGRRFAQYFHKQNGGRGSIWEDRYRSSAVDPQNYFLVCQRYIETLPITSQLVNKAEDYSWSSYRIHVGKEPNYGLNDADSFWNLGNTPFERQMNWKAFVEEGNQEKDIEVITNSLKSNRDISKDDFLIGSVIRSFIPNRRRGRPKKA